MTMLTETLLPPVLPPEGRGGRGSAYIRALGHIRSRHFEDYPKNFKRQRTGSFHKPHERRVAPTPAGCFRRDAGYLLPCGVLAAAGMSQFKPQPSQGASNSRRHCQRTDLAFMAFAGARTSGLGTHIVCNSGTRLTYSFATTSHSPLVSKDMRAYHPGAIMRYIPEFVGMSHG